MLRIREWAAPAVAIGRFQWPGDIGGECAAAHGIEVVRRISGGGAMFIAPGTTITRSIRAPLSRVEGRASRESCTADEPIRASARVATAFARAEWTGEVA